MYKKRIISCITTLFLIFGVLFFSPTQVKSQEQTVVTDFRFPIEPVNGLWWISQGFGGDYWYQSQDKKRCGYHLGVDFSCEAGTPLYSIADGIIKFANIWRGAGYTLVIQYKISETEYICGVYYHMKRPGEGGLSWEIDTQIIKDTVIGYVSGEEKDHSSVSHLHIGIRKGLYSSGTDKRINNWYYPGYTTIVSGECDRKAKTHQEILAEWLDPIDFLEQHLKPSQKFQAGDFVRVSGSVSFRKTPEINKDNLITGFSSDKIIKLIDHQNNGIFSDGYYWRCFKGQNDVLGWCAENYLEPFFTKEQVNLLNLTKFSNFQGALEINNFEEGGAFEDGSFYVYFKTQKTLSLNLNIQTRQIIYLYNKQKRIEVIIVFEKYPNNLQGQTLFRASQKPVIFSQDSQKTVLVLDNQGKQVFITLSLARPLEIVSFQNQWEVKVKPPKDTDSPIKEIYYVIDLSGKLQPVNFF